MLKLAKVFLKTTINILKFTENIDISEIFQERYENTKY